MDLGAFKVDAARAFAVDATKVKDAVAALTRELMTLQAHGDRARAGAAREARRGECPR